MGRFCECKVSHSFLFVNSGVLVFAFFSTSCVDGI